MTSFFLKRSNTANLIREKKGGAMGDERTDSSASVFEVANANGLRDLTAGESEFLSAAICRQAKKSSSSSGRRRSLRQTFHEPTAVPS